MARLRMLLLLASLIAACSAPAAAAPDKAACPATRLPENPEAIGPLYGPEEGLQVFLYGDGVWDVLGQKVFWKYPGYSAYEENTPLLSVTGEQLDGDGYFFEPGPATNAFAADLLGDAILNGVNIPHSGCWQLTGEYRGDTLSFVVWVEGQSD